MSTMSIQSQVNDAKILMNNGSYEGALSNILMAVAASSRRLYPKGTKSRKKPKDDMADNEAFKLFLGPRLAKIFCDYTADKGMSVNFKGKLWNIEDILYHKYRCELIHTGQLSDDVDFIPDDVNFLLDTSNFKISQSSDINVTISFGDKFIIDYGWIDVLISAVINAPSNYDLFDNGFKRLETSLGVDIERQFESDLLLRYDISKGRIEALKEVCAIIGIEDIKEQSYMELENTFRNKYVLRMNDYGLGGGIITGLRSKGVCDHEGNLTRKGYELLKEIANFYS
jgi:hypothetical protein